MTSQELIDVLPPEFEDKIVHITRASFRGKQDAMAVFQLLWETGDTVSERLGDATARRQRESAEQSGLSEVAEVKAIV